MKNRVFCEYILREKFYIKILRKEKKNIYEKIPTSVSNNTFQMFE